MGSNPCGPEIKDNSLFPRPNKKVSAESGGKNQSLERKEGKVLWERKYGIKKGTCPIKTNQKQGENVGGSLVGIHHLGPPGGRIRSQPENSKAARSLMWLELQILSFYCNLWRTEGKVPMWYTGQRIRKLTDVTIYLIVQFPCLQGQKPWTEAWFLQPSPSPFAIFPKAWVVLNIIAKLWLAVF